MGWVLMKVADMLRAFCSIIFVCSYLGSSFFRNADAIDHKT